MRQIWCIFPPLLTAAAAFSCSPVSLHSSRIRGLESGVSLFAARRRRSWDESYELLLSYKEEHGHTNVPQSEKPLGAWVNSQRIEHAKYLRWIEEDGNEDTELPKTSMDSRRKKLLDDVDFVWDAVAHTWITRYEELCDFRQEHGHCVVPRSNGRLGAWVEKMRIEHKKYNTLLTEENPKNSKLKTILTQDRVQKLNDIDFVWNVREKQFEQNLGELRIYKGKLSMSGSNVSECYSRLVLRSCPILRDEWSHRSTVYEWQVSLVGA